MGVVLTDAGQTEVRHKRWAFGEEWKLNTLDITVAVLLGVVQGVLVVAGAVDFFARMFQATGLIGIAVGFLFVTVYGTLIITTGYLRKRILAMVLSGAVVAMLRWLTGAPDGPLLLFYWAGAGLLGGLVLWAFRWREGWLQYGLAGALLSGWAGGSWFWFFGINTLGWQAYWVAQAVLLVGGFLFTGVLGYYVGTAVSRIGVSAIER
ncbi:MAG: hypothetical protein HYX52_07495 [Chloroflexi bacterium]|nr:hypothetical protein [Chloroflexota bacterium]